MSRAKSRQSHDVCADCGASDPTWASLNRGILLCIQCCSIHRSLGRHISQVKSLQKSNLNQIQLSTLYALCNSGVNNLWEHALLENGSKLAKKKPGPKDGITAKAEFIRNKHQNLSYVFRPNNEDGMLCVENELGKQLHASVRTNNLETSFRLLIHGADPNYFHDEKGTTPLHVAVKANQKEQAELLMIYGADPTFPDVNGLTPIDYAKQNVNKELANRLIENQYEVTDKFSYYLCLRKPDHTNGHHFITPQSGPKCEKAVLMKLQKLTNHIFEELAMDVYDEIERREIESIWLSCADTLELSDVPFLPVDPTLSTTRNQSRQKLGRFTTPELKALVHDMLLETARRQLISEKSKGPPNLRELSQVSDDDPLYDSVASDDDYAIVEPFMNEEQLESEKTKVPSPAKSTDENHNPKIKPTINSATLKDQTDKENTLELLEKKLLDSDTVILDLKTEVVHLKALVEHLSSENYELKTRLSQISLDSKKHGGSGCFETNLKENFMETNPKESSLNGEVEFRSLLKSQRPSSMFETRNWQVWKNQLKQNELARNTIQGISEGVNTGSNSCSMKLNLGLASSIGSNISTNNGTNINSNVRSSLNSSIGLNNNSSFGLNNSNSNTNTTQQPSVIIQYTDQLTKCIQELWNVIQGPGRADCNPYASKIRFAVYKFLNALPKEKNMDTVQHITDCVQHLQMNCIGLQDAHLSGDELQIDSYIQKVRKCAYEIAKDTKILITSQ